MELSDILKIEGLLVTLKAFVSIDHVFLRNTLEKFGFWKKIKKISVRLRATDMYFPPPFSEVLLC